MASGAYTHTYTHTHTHTHTHANTHTYFGGMKVIIRNQARAWFKNLEGEASGDGLNFSSYNMC